MFKADASEFNGVGFPDGTMLDLSVIWELTNGGPRRPLGIKLVVPGRVVDAWQPFETAYGTDGGEGAITSRGALDEMTKDASRLKTLDVDAASFVMSDADGDGNVDTIEFENGFGDGAFPMSRGLDAAGVLVGLVVWDSRLPWRLGVPEGTPPLDVTIREDRYLDCMSGKRPVVNGRCHVA